MASRQIGHRKLRGSAESGAQAGKLLFDRPDRRRREGRVGGQIKQVIEMDDARLQPQGLQTRSRRASGNRTNMSAEQALSCWESLTLRFSDAA